MDNIDFNKMLDMLSKMDKSELESKLREAQKILNSKDIGQNSLDDLNNKK